MSPLDLYNRTADAKYYTDDFSGYSAGNATWTTIGTTMDPYMVGPALDPERGSVYYITRSCATTRRKLLGGYICNKKGCFSMKNQIKPSGTQDTESCSNSSFTYAINRYNYGSKTYDLLYSEKVKIAYHVLARSFKICMNVSTPFVTPTLYISQIHSNIIQVGENFERFGEIHSITYHGPTQKLYWINHDGGPVKLLHF